MARFCFVSLAHPGHCDFGGMGFLRTATELMRRGHEVRWVLSRPWLIHHYTRICNQLKKRGIPLENIGDLHLTVNSHKKDVYKSSRAFSSYLASEHYDCVVVDRLCIGAAFAAHGACIVWAVVGTDGRDWSHQRLRSTLYKAVLPITAASPKVNFLQNDLCKGDFPMPSVHSDWATSPFLNISFFPRAYYEGVHAAALPTHSHFVGAGAIHEPLPVRDQLLITLGNSFNPVLRQHLIDIIRPVIRMGSIPTLILTGQEGVTEMLKGVFKDQINVTVKTWVPYDEAYRGMRVCIGHGGTSHLWYGMREGTPLLAIPFMGDQLYGGRQLERLNIGKNVLPFVLPWLSSRSLQRLGKIGVRLHKDTFIKKFQDVLTNETMVENSLRLSRLMRMGGGVEASTSLIESLANKKERVSNCLLSSCCC